MMIVRLRRYLEASVFLFIAIVSSTFCFGQERYQLTDLVNEFKNYTTTNSSFHAGDLYQHSVWVALTVNDWFHTKNSWTQGLDTHDRDLAMLAALLHDVGKAGDLNFSFYTKPGHEGLGQMYLLSKKTFLLATGEVFDFKKLFQCLGISEQDKQLISVLVAAHGDLGTIMESFFSKKRDIQTCFYTYISKLKHYAHVAGYCGVVDQRMIQLATLIAAADVRGSQRYELSSPCSIYGLHIDQSPAIVHPEAPDMFTAFQFNDRGIYLRDVFMESIRLGLLKESSSENEKSLHQNLVYS